ncbi:hypothetical protein HMPREF1545_01409 [Oscillibacter sp. KLE 1728]|nr:hypothetical protein HMPREF1545_01409 [Oscillibacter sp. KLE 1728]
MRSRSRRPSRKSSVCNMQDTRTVSTKDGQIERLGGLTPALERRMPPGSALRR